MGSIPDNKAIRFVTAHATVTVLDQDLPLSAEQSTRLAAWMPRVTNGEPTKLKVSTWMCHAGRNNNGLVFREQDLPASAAKIGAPNLLPMDWNHSAVVESWGEPKAIGAWYSAEVKWNPDAKKGEGAMGIWAEGIVWAWAFPEKAAQMIAMQEQKGYVEFSMACIPSQTLVGADNDGPYEVAIEPVFFTHSALDMPPADPDAKGTVALDRYEDDDQDDDDQDDMDDEDELRQPKAASLDLDAPEAVDLDEQAWLIDEERAVIFEMATAAKDGKKKPTNFPSKGDNKTVSLRSSQWKTFPLAYAQDLKDNWPEIWRRGGNIRGNDQFRKLAPVARRGGSVETAAEEAAVRLREAWGARHKGNSQLNGVVAQIKWLVVGSRGVDHMKSVINDAKQRVKARRAMRAKEEVMDGQDTLKEPTVAALDAALEANQVLKAQVEEAQSVNTEQAAKIAELEAAVEAAKASADEVAIARDAMQAELEAAAAHVADMQAQLETAQARLNEIEAAQAKVATEQRWTARFEALPESYRAAFAKRSEDEQARFVAKWSVASDEEWNEFKSDLLVGFGELKLSYLSLSKQEGALPSVGATDSDMSAKIAALKV